MTACPCSSTSYNFQEHCNAIRTLRLPHVSFTAQTKGQQVVSLLPNLEKIICNELDRKTIQAISKLKKIRLIFATYCPHLQNRSFRFLQQLQYLTTLVLQGCRAIGDKEFTSISKIAPLSLLKIDGCTKVTDVGFSKLQRLQNLAMIHLADCNQLTDSSIKNLLYFSRLKRCDIRNFSERPSDALCQNILCRHPCLEFLNQFYFEKPNREEFWDLLHNSHPTRKELNFDIYGCYHLDDAAAKHISTTFKQLTTLCAIGCIQLTSTGLIDLMSISTLSCLQLYGCNQKTVSQSYALTNSRKGLHGLISTDFPQFVWQEFSR